jgi:hypothetical protein
MKVKLLALATILIWNNVLFLYRHTNTQPDNTYFKINITANGSGIPNLMQISICKNAGTIKTVYKLKDSINNKELRENRRYAVLHEELPKVLNKANRDSILKILRQLDSITNKYTIYDTDSLTLNANNNTSYSKLLNMVSVTGDVSLENNVYNKGRIVLDGTMFEFKIQTGHATRTVYAHSPDPKSNPILYKLLSQTLEIYRKTKANNFLSLSRTGGY